MAPRSSSVARVDNLVAALGPGPWAWSELADHGWTRGMLQRAVASGLLVRERRGLYSWPERSRTLALLPPVAEPPRVPGRREAAGGPGAGDLHLARLRALARELPPRAAFSHGSAARVHGLWLPNPSETTVHVTVPGQADRQDAGVHVHGTGLPRASVVRRHGVAVTDVCRTAVDLARVSDLPHALIAVDSALRLLLAPAFRDLDHRLRRCEVPASDIEAARARLDDVVARMVGWPGVRTARAAIAAADPASASAYESWSRGWILAVGLPAPELNVPLVGASGREYAGDFVWRERRLVGEADGVSKYGTTAQEVRSALRAEKERQADLEAAGWRFVRWVPGDSGATITARLGRALYLAPSEEARGLRRGA